MPVACRLLRTATLAAVLAAAVGGCHRGGAGAPDVSSTPSQSTGADAAPQESSTGAQRIALDADARRRLGIELAPVASTDLEARAAGTAVVLDSAALAAQLADLDAARADADAARDSYVRLERLYRDGGNASRQARDAARAQSAAATAHLAAAAARARLEWGTRLVDGADAAAAMLRDGILRGQITLARAEFPERLPADAARMQYQLLDSRAADPGTVTFVEPSHAPVQSIQGTGVLIAISSTSATPSLLRPGERQSVIAATASGSTRPVVPAQAAVADGGQLWCYVARGDAAFERVLLDADGQVDAGFPANGVLAAGDLVVVRGAPILLSLERGSAPGSAADD